MKAVLTIEDEEIKGEIALVNEVEQGQCVGCVFDAFRAMRCPKDDKGKLICSSYSDGRTGVFPFKPEEPDE